jgi:hypothetical protein
MFFNFAGGGVQYARGCARLFSERAGREVAHGV